MSTYRIAIVENEEMYISQLREYLGRFNSENGNVLSFDVFTDGEMLVERYDKFDIIMMDIDMPILDGMAAAEEVRKIDGEVVIVFITNMAQYAIKGYSVGALDYVLKPINYFAFSQCLHRAMSRARKTAAEFVTLRVNRGIQKVSISDIKYVESRKHMLVYHTSAGEIVTAGTMKGAEAYLCKKNFAKCHSSYLVNLPHVSAIRDGFVVMGGESIPISRSKKAGFEAGFAGYIAEVTK